MQWRALKDMVKQDQTMKYIELLIVLGDGVSESPDADRLAKIATPTKVARFLKNVVDDGDVNTNTKRDEDGIEYESDDDDDDAEENADDRLSPPSVFAAMVLPPTDDTGFNPPSQVNILQISQVEAVWRIR